MTIKYTDPENGNDGNDGLSFAQRKKTILSNSMAAGDVIRVIASPSPTSLAQTAIFTNTSTTVTLNTAVNATVSNCDVAWTASTNVTQSQGGSPKEGTASQQFVIASGFTTGLVAYKTTASNLDLTGYQQICFWFQFSAGTPAASDFSIKLCSDSAGATPVNTLNLPAMNGTSVWIAILIDNGSALASGINSIALYRNTNLGAQTVVIDNVISVKAPSAADSLSFTSQIGKNNGVAGEGWYPIKSISGTTVIIDQDLANGIGAGRGYSGTTETVTIYKREPLKTGMLASGNQNALTSTNGTQVSPITISGGWNRTDMSSRNAGDTTLLSGMNGKSTCINFASGCKWFILDTFAFTRYNISVGNSSLGSTNIGHVYQNLELAGNNNGLTSFPCGASINNIISHNNTNDGISLSSQQVSGSNLYCYSNAGSGIHVASHSWNCKVSTAYAKNNNTYGLYFDGTSNCVVRDLTTASNGTAGIGNFGYQNSTVRAVIGEGTLVTNINTDQDDSVFCQDFQNVAGTHQIFQHGSTIATDTANRHTSSGICWAISPTVAIRSSVLPCWLQVARIVCTANKTTTVTIWVKRTNTGLTANLVCRGGQIAGVANDVIGTAVGSANVYEQLTISFTPTATGVVDIEVQAYGGTTYTAYFDDMGFTST